MKKRFMLTAAGAAATGVGAMSVGASAEIVHFNHQLDRWAGEHAFTVTDSNSSVVISMAGLAYGGVSNLTYVTYSSITSHWGSVNFDADLGAGTYTVVMVDTYGDGWAWGSFVGGLYVSGAASGGASLPSGSSTSFEFSVIPAPSALALLGLAGLAARRRK